MGETAVSPTHTLYPPPPLTGHPLLRILSRLTGWLLFGVVLAASGWLICRTWGLPMAIGLGLIFAALLVVDSYSQSFTLWLLWGWPRVVGGFKQDEVEFTMTFASGFASTGLLLVWVLIGLLDNWRRALQFIVVLALVGIGGHVVKVTVGRQRPADWRAQLYYHWGDPTGFPWLPVYIYGPLVGIDDSGYASFPAGHAITAFAEATVLASFYPPARPVFYIVAACVGGHRLYYGRHHLADVFFAAVMGHLLAKVLLSAVWVQRVVEYLLKLCSRLAVYLRCSWPGAAGRRRT